MQISESISQKRRGHWTLKESGSISLKQPEYIHDTTYMLTRYTSQVDVKKADSLFDTIVTGNFIPV